MDKSILIMVATVTCLFSVASSAMPGIATFYRSHVPHSTASTCYGNTNNGVIIAAAGDTLWNNGAACGKMFIVKCIGAQNAAPHPCTGKSVIVKIVRHCPGCTTTIDLSKEGCTTTIDLSKEAFGLIANPVIGKIKIAYRQI